MASPNQDPLREMKEEYRSWAQICLDKHGHPWPITEEELSDVSPQHLAQEIKKLRVLGRVPHE